MQPNAFKLNTQGYQPSLLNAIPKDDATQRKDGEQPSIPEDR